jgi:hypothetical protein
MAVTIDIPGVGSVEAKNAASEATLKEILKAMQAVQKNTTKKSGKGGGGGGGDATADDPAKGPGSALGLAFGKLSKAVMPVIGGFSAFGKALTGITNIIGDYANVGDSLERAAQQIPIFGGMLSTVAAASVKANDALLSASKSGAGFGGSLNQFAKAASSAGMTMDKFGALVAKNGEGMLGFGGTTEEGAKRFAQVSKSLRQSSNELYALGYSTEDVNQGLANYGELMRKQGLARGMSDAQLASGAKNYLKEMDALAKITGEERSAKEAQAKALMTDAQFQMSMAGKDKDVRADFQKMVLSFGPTLGGFVKDYMATGTLTTEANQKLAAMLGGDVMNEMTKLRQKMQNNQRLTDDEQDRLKQIMRKAAEANAKVAGTALAADRGMDDASKGMIEAIGLNDNAHKKAAEGQDKAVKEGDNYNKKIQESQQKLAQFSNQFTMVLANSGLLDFLMKSFGVMANLVQTFVVPAFQIMAEVLPVVVAGIGAYIAALAIQHAATMATAIATAALSVKQTFLAAATTLAALGATVLSAPFLAIAAVVGGVVLLFKHLYDKGWSFGTAIEAVKDTMYKVFVLGFKELLIKILSFLPQKLGGYSKEEEKAAKEGLAAEYKELDNRKKARDVKVDATKKERDAEKEKEKNAKKANALDAKIIDDKKAAEDAKNRIDTNAGPEELLKQFGIKENSKFHIDAKKDEFNKEKLAAEEKLATAKTTAEKKAAIGKIEEAEKKLADLDKLAKGEASPKDKSRESLPKAEAAKKELEAKGEEKNAAERKAAEEKAKAEEKSKEENSKKGKGSAPTQESAESLLASLNTKMDQLIKINKGTHEVNEQQLSVQKGLTSDLFAA